MTAILITGGSRGIGRATAVLAARRGWNVAFTYASDAAAAAQTLEAIRAEGADGLAIRADCAIEAEVIDSFAQGRARFGALDGVVVNAGIVAPPAPLADMSLERLTRVFDTNVLGAYLTAREAARTLPRDRGGQGGAIVIVSSAAARLGSPGEYVDYAGSKGALDTLTIGLAKELGPGGVRVNAVRPGLIETDIHASGGQPDRAWRLGTGTPLGRPGTAEEVAEAILYLLDAASSYVTGALLDVSGGR
ncbi:SDR family oxidoreductase [Zavarzinia sp. CC-PAN008]|uniref:SDR family oxidoreductase n=1 Tax=Zavarzinia sp. CC-PAN008 TaxID=3243332 RepID=UPI003F74349E